MTRKAARIAIITDVAENGKVTRTGLRAYIETRMSSEAFRLACAEGMRRYRERTGKPEASAGPGYTGFKARKG